MAKGVERLLRLLEHMAWSERPISVSQAGEELEIPGSAVHRLLGVLEKAGYACKDDQARYYLSLKIAALAAQVLEKLDVRELARPFLERLSIEAREAVHLGVLEDGEVVYIEKIDGPRKLRMASRLGERVPAHATAMGKVLLAALPEQEILRIIGRRDLAQRTAGTITDPVDLLNHLRTVKSQGHAIDNEENERGILCIGAPILDYTGRACAALSVSGSTATLEEESVPRITELVMETAREISYALGHQQEDLDLRT